jgi:hypothetical protein
MQVPCPKTNTAVGTARNNNYEDSFRYERVFWKAGGKDLIIDRKNRKSPI